jgi:CubicO group peptidase (beta-lactamase class C family)
VLVARDGDPLHARGYGSANLEHRAPITTATVFNVASISKQFTAMSILLLARDGKLAVEDDVRRHVPEVPDLGATITLHHLLQHTGGLRDQLHLLHLAGWRDDDVVTDRDVLDVTTRQRALNFRPGSEFGYTNTGYSLLARVVERVAGTSLRAFTEEHLFRPLGMTRTRFGDDHTEVVDGRAHAYVPRATGTFHRWMPAWDSVGHSHLLTTTEDLVRWAQDLVQPRVGDAATVARLLTPGRLDDGRLHGYAYGLEVGSYRGLRLVSHGGIQHGYRARFALYPKERFAIVVLGNLSTIAPAPLVRRITDVCIAHGLLAGDRVAASAPPTDAARAGVLPTQAGYYAESGSDALLRVQYQGGKLLVGWGPATVELAPAGGLRFRVVDTDIEVEFAPPTRVRITGTGREVESTMGTRTYERLDPARPTAAQLAEYAGEYASEEVGGTLVFEPRGDALTLRRRRRGPEAALEPTVVDGFWDGNIVHYGFTRRDGVVDGVRVATDRIRQLWFARRSAAAARTHDG